MEPVIWVLADDRAGNVNQALGVAEALGCEFVVKKIIYNDKGSWPNIIRNKTLLGIDTASSSELKSPWPDIILSAGRKTLPVASFIKRKSKNKSKIVQIMYPGFPSCGIDLMAVPMHDKINAGKNIVKTIGAPNRINKSSLAHQVEKWLQKFNYLPKPYVALLIGGDTKKGKFTAAHAYELANKVNLFFQDKDGSLLITNSRRTSPEVTKILKNEIRVKFYFHDFTGAAENPYFGYLAISDAIIASGDSISMCSEACSSGKPVYIYSPEDITPQKHRDFHNNLYKEGYAKPLSGVWSDWNYTPLEDANNIAKLIRKKLF